LIVPRDKAGDAFVEALASAVAKIRVAPFTADPEPFMGPVVNDTSAERLLAGQARLSRAAPKRSSTCGRSANVARCCRRG